MGLTHEFYLAPYSEFSHNDYVWEHADRLETVQMTDGDFDELQAEMSRIPTIGGPAADGLWREGSTVIDPLGAKIAADLLEIAALRVSESRLKLICRQLAGFARRAASGKYFIYHSGL